MHSTSARGGESRASLPVCRSCFNENATIVFRGRQNQTGAKRRRGGAGGGKAEEEDEDEEEEEEEEEDDDDDDDERCPPACSRPARPCASLGPGLCHAPRLAPPVS